VSYKGKILCGSLSDQYMRSSDLVVRHEYDGEIEVYKWHHTFGYWMFQYVEKEQTGYEVFPTCEALESAKGGE